MNTKDRGIKCPWCEEEMDLDNGFPQVGNVYSCRTCSIGYGVKKDKWCLVNQKEELDFNKRAALYSLDEMKRLKNLKAFL